MTEQNYIGPRNIIIGRLFQGHDNWMRHNFVGKIDSSYELDEGKAGFQPDYISPLDNVRFQIIHISLGTVVYLLNYSSEEQFVSVDKPLCAAGASSLLEAAEKPNRITTFRKNVCNVKK
jgi:hypothetical protein